MARENLRAIILAAGLGTRMRPLTFDLPKALLPVKERPLLDWALERTLLPDTDVAVNVHHHPLLVQRHLRGRAVHISDETSKLLGTAGAVAKLSPWLGGRDVLVVNSDMWMNKDIAGFIDSWDGRSTRLLVTKTQFPSDFGTHRYIGAALMPNHTVRNIPLLPRGLYEALWERQWSGGLIELFPFHGMALDCGTPVDYIVANLLARRDLGLSAPAMAQEAGHEDIEVLVSKAENIRGESIYSLSMNGRLEINVDGRLVEQKLASLSNQLKLCG